MPNCAIPIPNLLHRTVYNNCYDVCAALLKEHPLLNESKVVWLKLVNVVRFFELFSFCHASIEKEFNINIKVVRPRTAVYVDKTYFTILWSTPSRSCIYRIPGIIGTCLNLHIDKWTKALVITFNQKTVLIVITSVAVYLLNIIGYCSRHVFGG